MTGMSSMSNYAKSVKSKGVVIFASNTAETDYVSIANQNARLVKHFMGLPTTVITPKDSGSNRRFSTDTGNFVEWKNFGRHEAFEASPYDETILLDADYLVFDSSLSELFRCEFDYLLFNKNRYVNISQQPSTMGPYSLPYVWATAVLFRKTEQTRLLFELVAKVRRNYDYYRLLYNVQEGNFRNDYAFAIANLILNGNAINPHKFVPWPIHTFTGKIDSIEYSSNIVVKSDRAYVLPKQNLHIMSKAWLNSPALEKLVDQCLDNSITNKGS